MKPRIFVGSSVEGLAAAYAIQQNLDPIAEVTVWPQGAFELSRPSLSSLLNALDRCDFGIFVFSPDDLTRLRNADVYVTRDNVVFEFGIFLGRLGRERTFFIVPRDAGELHIPTDLAGITPATFVSQRGDGNLQAALGPACAAIASRVHELGLIHNLITGKRAVSEEWMSLLAAASQGVRIFAGDVSWATSDVQKIGELIGRGVDVRVLCVYHRGNAKIRENIGVLAQTGAAVRGYAMPTSIRALVVDWRRDSAGFALRVKKTPKTLKQFSEGRPSSPELYNYEAFRYFPLEDGHHVEALAELFDSWFVVGIAVD